MVNEIPIHSEGSEVVDSNSLTTALFDAGSGSVTMSFDQLNEFMGMQGAAYMAPLDGEKFYGGFGDTVLHYVDYWTLRARSNQLFNENLYARGLIRRLLTNVINTGLHLEAMPVQSILGLDDDTIDKWAELTEARFELYCNDKFSCDFSQQRTFGELQAAIKLEAMLDGDVLVVLRPNPITGIPSIQTVPGEFVQTPTSSELTTGRKIVDGVEMDITSGRHVAYWIAKEDEGVFSYERLPAYGTETGRTTAWLVYGSDKRKDSVRGIPFLQLIMQSLKEIDRNREAVQRKAVINSILSLWIEKSTAKAGTLPLQNSAVRRDAVSIADSDGRKRSYNLAKLMPGVVIDELQEGEKPHGFTGASNIEFGPFEAAILQAIAWAYEIPPEILLLSFNANYSASQAAINEFKIFLDRERDRDGKQFCQPIYIDWLISSCLAGITEAPGFLEAWRDVKKRDVFNAWVFSDWAGAVKPSTDMKKQTQGYKAAVDEGWITNDRVTRELTGMKWRRNIKILAKENQLKVEAMAPIIEMQAKLKAAANPQRESEPAPAKKPAVKAEDSNVVPMQAVHIHEARDKKRLRILRSDDGSLSVEEI